MFPYKDDNPTVLTPFMTVGIIAATSAIWILYQGGGAEPRLSQSVCDLGAIPARLFCYPAAMIKLFTKPDLLAAARRQPLMFTTSQPWRY